LSVKEKWGVRNQPSSPISIRLPCFRCP